MQSFKELEMSVLRWAEERKIIPNSYPLAQTRKTVEEATELLEAAAQLRVLNRLIARDKALANHPDVNGLLAESLTAFRDAVGDTVVTLINACALADVDLTECLSLAYDEIKDRKGTLLPSGVFLKHEASNT